jgi:hypothetical protein
MGLTDLKQKSLIFITWPQYKLPDQEVWPENDCLNFDTILQLYLYCHCLNQWSQVPYVQNFLALSQDPDPPIHLLHALPKSPPNFYESADYLPLNTPMASQPPPQMS